MQADLTEKKEKAEQLLAFSERLKQLAGRQGFRQSELARLLDVRASAVGQWFRGKNFPGPAVEYRLADLLGVPHLWLMEGKETPENQENPAMREDLPRSDPGGRMKIESLYELPPANPTRQQIEAYVKAYLDQAERTPGGLGLSWALVKKHFDLEDLKRMLK